MMDGASSAPAEVNKRQWGGFGSGGWGGSGGEQGEEEEEEVRVECS